MSLKKPAHHGNDHRPPLALGPDDPGGQDPIPGVGGLKAVVASYDGTTSVDDTTPGGLTFGGNLTFGTELFSYGAGNDSPAALATGLYIFAIEVVYTGAGDPGKFVNTLLTWNDPVVLSQWTAQEWWPLTATGGPPGISQSLSGPAASFWLTAGQTGSLAFQTDSASTQSLGVKATVALIS